MVSPTSSSRPFQLAVLGLLAVGVGLLVVQQRRISKLEAKLDAQSAPAASPRVASDLMPKMPVAPPPGRRPGEVPRFQPVPSAATGTVTMSGLTQEEAFAMVERLRLPTPPAGDVNVPAFLSEQRIGPELWKKVQAVNAKAAEELHALARDFPSGSVAESEARFSKIDAERRAAVGKLLSPKQLQAYEAMRVRGEVEGVIALADGVVSHWVYRY